LLKSTTAKQVNLSGQVNVYRNTEREPAYPHFKKQKK